MSAIADIISAAIYFGLGAEKRKREKETLSEHIEMLKSQMKQESSKTAQKTPPVKGAYDDFTSLSKYETKALGDLQKLDDTFSLDDKNSKLKLYLRSVGYSDKITSGTKKRAQNILNKLNKGEDATADYELLKKQDKNIPAYQFSEPEIIEETEIEVKPKGNFFTNAFKRFTGK